MWFNLHPKNHDYFTLVTNQSIEAIIQIYLIFCLFGNTESRRKKSSISLFRTFIYTPL